MVITNVLTASFKVLGRFALCIALFSAWALILSVGAVTAYVVARQHRRARESSVGGASAVRFRAS